MVRIQHIGKHIGTRDEPQPWDTCELPPPEPDPLGVPKKAANCYSSKTESSATLAYYACRSSSRSNCSSDRALRSIIFPFAFRKASIWRLRVTAAAVSLAARSRASCRARSSLSYSACRRSKSSVEKFPSYRTPRRTHSKHFVDASEK
jgi:hypothetical protein